MNFNRRDFIGKDPKTHEKIRLIILTAFFDYPKCVIEPRHPSTYEYWYDESGKHVVGINNYGFRKIKKRVNHSIKVTIVYHLKHWKKITRGFLIDNLLKGAAYVRVKAVDINPFTRSSQDTYFIPTWYATMCYTTEIEITSKDFDKKKDCFLRRLLKEKEKDFSE